MKPADAAQQSLIKAVKVSLREGRKVLEPVMAARPEPEFQDPEIRFVQVAQNTLRTCLEATLQAAMPYSETTPIQLAIRLASYAISALPLEQQDAALRTVIDSLPNAHSVRLARGIIIQTEWETHGHRHPNVPGGRA